MIYIMLAFAIAFSLLAIINLQRAFMLLLFALPIYTIRWNFFGIPTTALEIMVLISFTVWSLKYTNFKNLIKGKYGFKNYFLNRKKRNSYPFALEMILLLFISFLAVGIAGFSNSALGIWKAYFFEPILVFILIINIFKSKKDYQKIIFSLVLSALAVSIFAVYQKITGQFIFNELWANSASRRVVSFFGYPNAVGLYLAPIIMIMIGWLVKRKADQTKKETKQCLVNFAILLTIILSFLAIFFAKSEGALVALAVALVIYGLLAGKRIRWVTVIFVIVLAGVVMSQEKTRQYALEKIALKDLSGEIRKQQWRETWEMVKSSPTMFIFGTGLNNYQASIRPYHQGGIYFNKDKDPDFYRKIHIFDDKYKAEHWQPVEIYMYPHNILLNFWTELGLAGVLLFMWLIGKYFYLAIGFLKQKNWQNKFFALGLITAMITIVVHGLVDVPYFKNDLAVIFWLLFALLSLLKLHAEQDKIK